MEFGVVGVLRDLIIWQQDRFEALQEVRSSEGGVVSEQFPTSREDVSEVSEGVLQFGVTIMSAIVRALVRGDIEMDVCVKNSPAVQMRVGGCG